jgi:hypothetical protein
MSGPTLLVKGSLSLSDKAKMAKANRDLPINYIILWLKKRMPEYGYNKANLEDRILIVRAETGSGKSTVLPVEVFRILRNKDTPISEKYTGQMVICTQPRISPTTDNATRIAEELGVPIEEVSNNTFVYSNYNPSLIDGQ